MTAVLAAPETREDAARRGTTLFEVIGDLQDAYGPEADEHIVAAVLQLLRTGRMTFLRPQRVVRELEDASREPVYS